ncbi:signal transduction histidine kinase [Oleiphilus messinensis]|uniref:Signal transduction histidine kinase n=1 Tax=Oleiphilus messinensis TaxID=141451 RepID=A0A1Y0I1V5_9GAMM|nr:histidine kinase [Oleiphilus messinensis]ARU54478.1 signal transduction histidine kinase [Oleiphilus messinensis]
MAQSHAQLTSKPRPRDNVVDFFLPDLCKVHSVIFLVIVTELVALVFTLVQPNTGPRSWTDVIDWNFLGLVSLFGQCLVLSCAAVLCIARNWLSTLSVRVASLLCFSLILVITLIFSLMVDHFFAGLSLSEMTGRPISASESWLGVNHWFVIRNLIIGAIISGIILRYFYLQYQWQNQRQAETRAKLQALQSRIRPHFLFNSMNSIASLIAIDPDKAENAVLDLSELFRATLKTDQLLIPIGDELSLCRRYLNIEKLRLGSRLDVLWDIRELPKRVQIPPLTLQPLVENAIYHGIQPIKSGGTIHVLAYQKNNSVYVMISNPYKNELQQPHRNDDQPTHKGNQVALDNIRSRLQGIYGPSAVLKSSTKSETYTVTLRFPLS